MLNSFLKRFRQDLTQTSNTLDTYAYFFESDKIASTLDARIELATKMRAAEALIDDIRQQLFQLEA